MMQMYIVMKFFESEILLSFTFEKKVKKIYSLNLENKVKIAHDTALAIAFLHMQEPSIIHRDIKPHNILVNQRLDVKLCDMG